MWALAIFVSLVAAACAAPDDYEYIDGLGYYKVYTYKSKWEEAMTACYFQGGHLAVVNSEAEAEALKNLMAENSVPYYAHIGFSDLFSNQHYVTVTGVPIEHTGYTRWEGGIHENIGWRCGSLAATGEITNRNCDELLPYICEIDAVSDYVVIPEVGKYKLHEQKVTWGEALSECHQEGSTLVVFNSDEEVASVLPLIANLEDSVHVGIHDRYREAYYTTVDGGKVETSGYNKWVPNQPIKSYTLNNVAVNNEGLYNQQNATVVLPFLCEKHI